MNAYHLHWTAKLTYYFAVKCNRFGELVPSMLDCHVSGIPFQLMCQGYFLWCSSTTVSVLMLCIISCVCLSGMEAISLLLLKTSWIMSKVVQYWRGWVITQIHLTYVGGPVELLLLLRRLNVWALDLNGRFYRSLICQVSVSREFPFELAVLGSKVAFRHFLSNKSMQHFLF